MRAAFYGRFSTDKQRDASIDDQYRECERLAKTEGVKIVARFEDKGISGGTTSRPGYQSLLAGARRHDFDLIITEDISRLWRNRAEFGPRSAELEDLGIHCLTCVGDDTRRDGWGLVLQIKSAMAEQTRREASYRTRRGLEGNAIAGKPTGGNAYGYIPAKDSASGKIEIHAEHAVVVNRIFEMYADGMSARNIAAALNAQSVPSPGARWRRTSRRRDGKWLASAIHGDQNRGTGILNNRRYVGIILWGRSEWKRSAADSKKRRHKMLACGSGHETVDENMRLIPQVLWDRVKARQQKTRDGIGALVRGGLRVRAPGAGRPSKHLFSGLLTCGVCEASFVMRNRMSYACASWWNGAACSNSINVPKTTVEEVMLSGIREDLTNPEVINEFERRARAAMRQLAETPTADHSHRIARLVDEVANLTDAIAAGGLRGSPAIAQRLHSAESELARLQGEQRAAKAPALLVPDIKKRFLGMARRLDALRHDHDRGQEALRDVLGDKIRLQPDQSEDFLWADYSLGFVPLLASGKANADLIGSGGRI